MNHIEFQNLHILDFMSIGDAQVDLSTLDVSLLLGENRDSLGANDNGSGKSSLFEALRWCLFGETTKQTVQSMPVEHVIRSGSKTARVVLTFCKDGETVIMSRSRSKSGGKLKLSTLMTDYEGKAAQEMLDSLLPLDKVQFSNLVSLSGSYPKLFARATDKERKDILSELVEIAIVAKMQDVAKSRGVEFHQERGELNDICLKAEIRVEASEGQIKQLSVDIKEHKAVFEELKKRVKAGKESLAEHKKSCDVAKTSLKSAQDSCGKELRQLQTRRTNLRAEIKEKRASAKKAIKDFRELEASLKDEATRAQTLLSTYNMRELEITKLVTQGACPTCQQDIGKTTPFIADTARELNAAIEESVGQWEDIRDKLSEVEAERTSAQEVFDESVELLDKALLALDDEEEVVREDADITSEVAAYEVAKQAVTSSSRTVVTAMDAKDDAKLRANKAILRRKKLRAERVEYKDLLKEISVRMQEIEGQITDIDFWRKGFGTQGIPALFVGIVLPKISFYIQRYADVLSGGDIRVSLDAFTENKSGTVKGSIQIKAENLFGADVYGGNSSGEKNRIDLAVTLGLIEYFKEAGVFSSNLLICDEIFDGLDDTGVQKALEALRLADIANVCVVSHRARLRAHFTTVHTMIKESGVSAYTAA